MAKPKEGGTENILEKRKKDFKRILKKTLEVNKDLLTELKKR